MKHALAAVGVLLLSSVLIFVLVLDAIGSKQACNPAALTINPESVPSGPIAGYGHEQLVNAAIIAKVATDKGLPARAQLIGIMTAMGESSLVNIGYGDDIHGVVNPDGTATCSLGLFQQQWCLGWGTAEQVMDPVYAAGAFYDRLAIVPGWEDMDATLAINRVQGNADPFHYARYEAPAVQILDAIGSAVPGTCGGSGEWAPVVDMTPPGLHVSDWFGMRDASLTGQVWLHSGIDLAAPTGTLILAASSGTVKTLTMDPEMGLHIKLDHGDGTETWYLHLSGTSVQQGDAVATGQVIGMMGNSGLSFGSHLHLTVVVDGERIDPIPFMRARGIDYCTLPQSTSGTTKNTCQ